MKVFAFGVAIQGCKPLFFGRQPLWWMDRDYAPIAVRIRRPEPWSTAALSGHTFSRVLGVAKTGQSHSTDSDRDFDPDEIFANQLSYDDVNRHSYSSPGDLSSCSWTPMLEPVEGQFSPSICWDEAQPRCALVNQDSQGWEYEVLKTLSRWRGRDGSRPFIDWGVREIIAEAAGRSVAFIRHCETMSEAVIRSFLYMSDSYIIEPTEKRLEAIREVENRAWDLRQRDRGELAAADRKILSLRQEMENLRSQVHSDIVDAQSVPDVLSGIQGIRRHMYTAGGCYIYFLVREGRVVYVGQSRRLGSRLATHALEGKKEFDSVFCFHVESSEMDAEERRWIEALDPEYNVTYSPSHYAA